MFPESSARPVFPSYLLPSIKIPIFRRRSASSSTPTECTPPSLSSSTTSSPSSSPVNSSSFIAQRLHAVRDRLQSHTDKAASLPPASCLAQLQPATLKCGTCGTDLAFASQIVSKGFTGRHGRAYLVAPAEKPNGSQAEILINTKVGRSVNRQLLTGAHVVADVTCTICQMVLGWKYVDAKESAQKYKIGKFILETQRVVACTTWGDGLGKQEVQRGDGFQERPSDDEDENGILFDSEDEDECEDLFAGTWDPVAVARRRGHQLSTRAPVDPLGE